MTHGLKEPRIGIFRKWLKAGRVLVGLLSASVPFLLEGLNLVANGFLIARRNSDEFNADA